jgi:hypothetical protein
MRIESSVTSISWIPSEAVRGLPKLPFEAGLAHYDDAPPDQLEDLDAMREADLFREANELRGWIEVEDDRIVDCGYSGRGHIGVTRVKLGRREITVPAVALPTLRAEVEVKGDSARFVQTAGGRTGVPAPRHVRGKPFFQVASALAWTTLGLTIRADGSSEYEVVGASPFPRHWIYDDSGRLVGKSGLIDFDTWYREAFGKNTPWGEEDSPAVITAVESALERELSTSIMRSGKKPPKPKQLGVGDTLVSQGDEGNELFLLLDGVLAAEVDDELVAEIGPGAILGERAVLEGGKRTATLRARTPCKVVVVPGDQVDPEALVEVAAGHRRES